MPCRQHRPHWPRATSTHKHGPRVRAGAVAAIAVGVSNTFASYAFCGLLLAFFVSSSLLTRVSSGFKKRYDAEHKKDGQRNWVQVACNGVVPSVLACLYIVVTSCGHAPFLHGCDAGFACDAGPCWCMPLLKRARIKSS